MLWLGSRSSHLKKVPPFRGGAGVEPTGLFELSEATGGRQRPEEDGVLSSGPSSHLPGK